MFNTLIIFFLLMALSIAPATGAFAGTGETTVYTYRSAESMNDVRYDYDNALLKLALENTVDTDGPYELVASPVMNYARARSYVERNLLPNFFIKLTYQDDFDERKMSYVSFPIDLGIVGYRVCFVSPEAAAKVAKVTTLEELRQFTHGQGNGWSDTFILRHNGFTVQEVGKYENLFTMVAGGRFDLFCRGTNELLGELNSHVQIENLLYDKSIVISYPLPRFFYTNVKNTKALDRVERGIKIAYENGSLKKLWEEQYQQSIDFVRLQDRKKFELENPLNKNLDFDYKKYFINSSGR